MSDCKIELSIDYLQQRISNVRKMNPHLTVAQDYIVASRLMMQAANNIQQQVELDMAKDGLVGAAWMVLMITYSSEEQKVIASDICAALDQNKSTTSRVIDSLIDKQLVNRSADNVDRRKVYLHITPQGKKYVEEKLAIHEKYTQKIWAGIDIHAFLPQVNTLLQNTYQHKL